MQVEGYSIDAQKELLVNLAKSKEFENYEFYIDGGFSGKNLNRPAISKLIDDVKNHKISCVMVYKLDRISRSQKDTLYLIEEIFNKYNVGFISIRENFDTTSPFGKAMIGVLSVFAQLERETILERTRLGMEKRLESGLWRGGAKTPYGYRYDKNSGLLIVYDEEKNNLLKMAKLYISGYSFGKIGMMFNMDESLVESRLINKTYTGIIKHKEKEFQGKFEPIFSKELYEKIMEVNKLRSKSRTERHYLLSGKIYCGHCGAKYRYQKWGKRLICYCYSQQKSKPKYIKDHNCTNKRYDTFEIEDAMLENIFKMSVDDNFFNKEYYLQEDNVLQSLEEKKSNKQKQIHNLIELASLSSEMEEVMSKIKTLKDESEKLTIQISKIKTESKKVKHTKKILKNLSSTWFNMSFEERRLIIMNLIDKIVVDNNNINIYYKII